MPKDVFGKLFSEFEILSGDGNGHLPLLLPERVP